MAKKIDDSNNGKKSVMDKLDDGRNSVDRAISFVDWIRSIVDWIKSLVGR